MQKLDKILIPALAKKGMLGIATSAQICFYAGEWKKVAFKPVSFSRGTLKVSVRSSTAASELQMREESLISFVNEKFKKEIVKKVRILNFS